MNRLLIPLVLALTACDPTPPPEPEATRAANRVFETQIHALEKARTAENQLSETGAEQRRRIDEATGR